MKTGLVGTILLGFALLATGNSVLAQDPPYNYAEALQKGLFFYAAQRSGELPDDNPVIWRGDSALLDGAAEGIDLTGGWYDAGDHVKFGLPMASTAATLGWAVYEYGDRLDADLLAQTKATIRWATDYFIKAHTAPEEFYYQVGDGSDDHAWWGPVEVVEEVMQRPAFAVTSSSPGSTVTAATATALAIASIIFADEAGYAATCLQHAKELFDFAWATQSDAGYAAAVGFYTSFNGFWDELSAAAAWLYLATDDPTYLAMAETAAGHWARDSSGKGRRTQNQIAYKWTHSWDDMHYMASILLARSTHEPLYIEAVERNLDYWLPGGGISYTPGGLAWLDQWGSLRYAANAAFLALVWSDTDLGGPLKKPDYVQFAERQVNYILGDNPRSSSYVIGFGSNPPHNPHHRTSHGAWYNDITAPTDNQHTLFGALVGGPDLNDNYSDDRGDYVSNEVATDYNAGLFGALIRMNAKYPGILLEGFPELDFTLPEERLPEYFVRARLLSESATSTQVITQTSNRSAWPATVRDQLKYRYFFDLAETFAAGYGVDGIVVTRGASEAGAISGPHPWGGTVYYIEVNLSGTKIYPAGRAESERDTTFTISAPSAAAWDPSNDWSHQGLVTSFTYEPVDYTGLTPYIALYDGNTLLSGLEPGDIGEPPPPPPPAIDMHVHDIDLSAASQGPRKYAVGAVTVVDVNGAWVANASVSINWSGIVSGTDTATTDSNGVVVFSSPKTKAAGTVTLKVTGITASGYKYQSQQNEASISWP